MSNICHFSSVHSGLDTRIFYKECKSLAEAGHDVHLVITATEKEVDIASRAGVKLLRVTEIGGRWGRIVKKTRKVYKIAKETNSDIYHFHDPELIFYGVILKILGKKVIYDVHEDVPRDVLEKDWIPFVIRNLVASIAGIMEFVCARFFLNIITATPHIENRFRKATAHVANVNNYPLNDELMTNSGTRAAGRNICYVGGIMSTRGVYEIVEALPLIPDVRLILCGKFTDAGLEAAIKAAPGWSQVDYRGQCDRSGVRNALSESRIGMVTLLPTKAYVNSLPIKMFEYMSAGLPVIASNFPLWKKILETTKSGLCVDPRSPEAIAGAVSTLLNDRMQCEKMGEAGRKAVLEKYNWNSESKKLLEFYKRLK